MVTVKQFLDAGFEFVVGDEIFSKTIGGHIINDYDLMETVKDKEYYYEYGVIELDWRKNTGVQPVGGDCWVEVEYNDGEGDVYTAKRFNWGVNLDIVKWRPHLPSIIEKSKMNDNQEQKLATEMSERDIENYSDNCDVEVAWENGDLCQIDERTDIYDGLWQFGCDVPNSELAIVFRANSSVYMTIDKSRLSKPETQEQKAARERIESAYDLYLECGMQTNSATFEEFKTWGSIDFWLSLVDKTGYRKQ